MKKYLTFLLLLETFNLYAQTSGSVTYDCNINKLSNYKEIFHNNSFNFVLTNINTFKDKVKINSNPTIYNSVPPDLINKYLFVQDPAIQDLTKQANQPNPELFKTNASPNLDILKKDYFDLVKSVE